MTRRIVTMSVLVSLLSVRACAVEDTVNGIPYIEMPERVYKALRQALESYPFRVPKGSDWPKQNADALEHLRTVPWPDLGKLERVQLHDPQDGKRFFNVWHVPGEGDEMLLLMPISR